MKRIVKSYDAIIAPANLWRAWTLFRRGKRHRADVRRFDRYLEDNLLTLREELLRGAYRHGSYRTFTVHDQKRREINVPAVRDQIVHQAIWNILFPFFNRRFSTSVYSCRPDYGTHRAVLAIRRIGRCIAQSGRTPFVLYIDIVKFFDSCRHDVLRECLRSWIVCEETLRLLDAIIASYDAGVTPAGRRGIPLGNLTSQFFCNVILMPLDRFMEMQGLNQQYVRYGDDCLIVSHDRGMLEGMAHTAGEVLSGLGFVTRMQVRRLTGFEALGKRFFADGIAIRRETRSRALRKAEAAWVAFSEGCLGASSLDARMQSHLSLPEPVNDPRWTRKLRTVILEKTYG